MGQNRGPEAHPGVVFLKPPVSGLPQPGLWLAEEYSKLIWTRNLSRILSKIVIGTVTLLLSLGTQHVVLAWEASLPHRYLAQSQSSINI